MQQNSESTYQGGESMQKIKAKENMQDPETCRGCVMPFLKSTGNNSMKQTSVDPEPTENKGSMHFKRQQKRNCQYSNKLSTNPLWELSNSRKHYSCITLDYLTNQKAGTKLSLQVLFALVKQTQRLGVSMYILSDRRHTVLLHCLSCETVIDREEIRQTTTVRLVQNNAGHETVYS